MVHLHCIERLVYIVSPISNHGFCKYTVALELKRWWSFGTYLVFNTQSTSCWLGGYKIYPISVLMNAQINLFWGTIIIWLVTRLRPALPGSATWRLGAGNRILALFGVFWHFLANFFAHFYPLTFCNKSLISGLFRAENRRVQFMSNYCNSTQFAQNCSKLTGAMN